MVKDQKKRRVIRRDVLPDGSGEIIEYAPDSSDTISNQERHMEQVARGYFLGKTSRNRNKELQRKLEDKVTKKIGRKGKLITDKLFELIDGVYIAQTVKGKNGKLEEIKYYKEKPDLKAITYALDRALGKPRQHVSYDDENEGLKTVSEIVKSLAKNESAKNKNK